MYRGLEVTVVHAGKRFEHFKDGGLKRGGLLCRLRGAIHLLTTPVGAADLHSLVHHCHLFAIVFFMLISSNGLTCQIINHNHRF